ncbi:YcxB family protein [Streptomyces lusitanus]|uniref:YcxB family protein n=1 Tax=Streptomyces lusitanus TaxID=68232 RepID=A0ABU3K0A9_9ACTN|nr:YcxB family protein [Streptomyces lusitanus]
MEDRAETAEGERVELEYQVTREDMRQALGARAKASDRGRRIRQFALIGAAVFVGASVVPLADGETPDTQSLVIAGVLVVLLLVAQPWLTARQFHKIASRHGACRATVDDVGATVSNAGGSSRLNWTAAPYYAETPDTFVLLSGDKDLSCLTVLPKRGVREPEGVDGIRALLDRHIRRL